MSSPRAFRGIVAAVLAVIVGGLFAVQVRETGTRAARRIGISIDTGTRGLEVTHVEKGLPAERAGIRKGDTVVAIEGHPVHKLLDYEVAAQELERGTPASYRVLRDGREIELHVVPGVEFPVFRLASDTVALLGYLGLALLVLFQDLRDARARLLFVFAAAVAFELALPYDAIGRPLIYSASLCLYYLLTGLEMGVELHLASVIPRAYDWIRRRPWLVWTYYGIGLGFGIATAVTYLAEDVLGRNLFPWSSPQVETVLLQVGIPLWSVAVPAILVLQMLRAATPRGRHQAGLVLAGVVPWTVYVLVQVVFESQGRVVPEGFAGLETLALLAYPVAIFAAIYRYQLFDIELVVRRGLVYTLLTGTLIVAFYAALGTGGALFSNVVRGGSSVWFISALTLALGLLFAPLRRSLQSLIDRKFFPERYELRQRLISLASELPGYGKLPLMGSHLVERLGRIFAVHPVSLLLADPESGLLVPLAATRPEERNTAPTFLVHRQDPGVEALVRAARPVTVEQLAAKGGALGPRLRQLDGSFAVPLLVQGELIGILVLGPKEAGERFPGEELELLNFLAHHAAIVFQNARLFESATYESLTGLLRREAILDVLSRELERAGRYGRPLTVGMADLDHFKEVNDRYGHLAGDTLLKRVAQALAGGLRSTDAVGRYGGEEFLIVLPETDLAGARVVADKLRRLVEEARAPMEDGEDASVTVSIGLASRTETDATSADDARELLARADRALYKAKQEGRNRIHPSIAKVS